jgi:pyruvate kinase
VRREREFPRYARKSGRGAEGLGGNNHARGSRKGKRRGDGRLLGYGERVTRGSRRTKIVCTIGPASSSPEMIDRLVDAGMDAARLNFSHGSHEDHARHAELIRASQERVGRPLALIADLQGPKIRIGKLAEPRELRTGDEVTVVPEGGNDGGLPVSPAVLSEVLRPGHNVLIDDGLIRLRVDAVNGGAVRATVLAGGVVNSNKGVNIPGVPLPVPSVTEKDKSDLEFALGLGIDYVALSFVRSANDVRQLRELLHEAGSSALTIAKIEKAEAVDDLSGILRLADAVMVARGDLGVEIGPAEVPLVQKRILLAALAHGKPAITATQMLESMLQHPEPTRAEASDVANAILDGTSAVMLSGETAVGSFPIESVETMDKIARAVEPSLLYRHELIKDEDDPYATVGEAMSNAACDIAEVLDAAAILVPTYSGRTASAVARHRPTRPVIAATHKRYAAQQLAIEWGVVPTEIQECADVEELWARTLEASRATGIVAPGDRVVITAGTAVNIPGTTNLIKVETA